MSTAEGREKIVKRHLVKQVGDFQRRRKVLPLFRVKQIVAADPDIEHIPGLDAVRVVIVVLCARSRQPQQLRCNGFSGAIRRSRPRVYVATMFPHDNPMDACWAELRIVSAAVASGTPLTTRPLS